MKSKILIGFSIVASLLMFQNCADDLNLEGVKSTASSSRESILQKNLSTQQAFGELVRKLDSHYKINANCRASFENIVVLNPTGGSQTLDLKATLATSGIPAEELDSLEPQATLNFVGIEDGIVTGSVEVSPALEKIESEEEIEKPISRITLYFGVSENVTIQDCSSIQNVTIDGSADTVGKTGHQACAEIGRPCVQVFSNNYINDGPGCRGVEGPENCSRRCRGVELSEFVEQRIRSNIFSCNAILYEDVTTVLEGNILRCNARFSAVCL